MTNYPTKLNPWYVVIRPAITPGLPTEYWHSPDADDFNTWKAASQGAMLFMSLDSATVVADMEGEGIEIRPLWKKEQLKDYRS